MRQVQRQGGVGVERQGVAARPQQCPHALSERTHERPYTSSTKHAVACTSWQHLTTQPSWKGVCFESVCSSEAALEEAQQRRLGIGCCLGTRAERSATPTWERHHCSHTKGLDKRRSQVAVEGGKVEGRVARGVSGAHIHRARQQLRQQGRFPKLRCPVQRRFALLWDHTNRVVRLWDGSWQRNSQQLPAAPLPAGPPPKPRRPLQWRLAAAAQKENSIPKLRTHSHVLHVVRRHELWGRHDGCFAKQRH